MHMQSPGPAVLPGPASESLTNSHSANKLLNSWKEIAQYLSRGVRTVQRWERDLRLPVRRPYAKKRSAVIAFSGDIDAWLQQIPPSYLAEQTQPGSENCVPYETIATFVRNRELMHQRMKQLQDHTERLMRLLVHMKRQPDSKAAA